MSIFLRSALYPATWKKNIYFRIIRWKNCLLGFGLKGVGAVCLEKWQRKAGNNSISISWNFNIYTRLNRKQNRRKKKSNKTRIRKVRRPFQMEHTVASEEGKYLRSLHYWFHFFIPIFILTINSTAAACQKINKSNAFLRSMLALSAAGKLFYCFQ